MPNEFWILTVEYGVASRRTLVLNFHYTEYFIINPEATLIFAKRISPKHFDDLKDVGF